MAPEPATTTTVTAKCFGESVAKQSTTCSVALRWYFNTFDGRRIRMESESYYRAPGAIKRLNTQFNFHTMYGEPYWREDAYYKLTLAQWKTGRRYRRAAPDAPVVVNASSPAMS